MYSGVGLQQGVVNTTVMSMQAASQVHKKKYSMKSSLHPMLFALYNLPAFLWEFNAMIGCDAFSKYIIVVLLR